MLHTHEVDGSSPPVSTNKILPLSGGILFYIGSDEEKIYSRENNTTGYEFFASFKMKKLSVLAQQIKVRRQRDARATASAVGTALDTKTGILARITFATMSRGTRPLVYMVHSFKGIS